MAIGSAVENIVYGLVALITIFTIPSLRRLVLRAPSRFKLAPNASIYEDIDGKATKESMSQYSVTKASIAILASTSLGLAVSFAEAVFVTVRKHGSYPSILLNQTWLLCFTWVLLLLQFLDTSRESDIVPRFESAISRLPSCLLVIILASTVFLGELSKSPDFIIIASLTVAQLIGALAVTVAILGLPRRPDVFAPSGRVVEREYKVSLWSRYAFNWNSELLDLAATKLIEVSDLPAMTAHARSKEATARFNDMGLKPTLPLWTLIFWQFRTQLAIQYIIVAISTLCEAAPHYTMLKILQYLEARGEDYSLYDARGWLCVLGLFAATLTTTLFNFRIIWKMCGELALPLRCLLSGLIFEKTTRMKNSSEPPQKQDRVINEVAPETTSASSTGKVTDNRSNKLEQGNSKPLDSQQDVVNMFLVDTTIVSAVVAQTHLYIIFTGSFAVYVTFLWFLVGWESLLAGSAAIAVFVPINRYLAKRYSSYQKALMQARDKKTTIIKEALYGIRQIKVSTIEEQWYQKIEDRREEELKTLWKASVNNVYMKLGSELAPALLTVACLATYTYIHGELLPSVAFTALGVFIRLEGILGWIPQLVMATISAKVSFERIDTFLRSPEKIQNTHPGDKISFRKASVSFPSNDKESRGDRFVLRPTGSGKSLLLAAILGEVDVLSGHIQVPISPQDDQRFVYKATAANWILPTSMAFVSQIPWIENASIKSNILFGLPFDEARYDKVIAACALTQDLAMLEDGDETEVGDQGITLSGGQKWRLTLARAFYSRAGILILDDVFSALDAHVGKHIYDQALTGELSHGRTRILVTHHVSLCLPRARYAVQLGVGGTLENAGLVDDQRNGIFQDILEAEQQLNLQKSKEDETISDRVNSEPAFPSIDKAASTKAKTIPKKLVEDEKRETGSVKKSVYLSYLKASGGLRVWTFIVLIYAICQAFILGRSWWIRIWTGSYQKSQTKMIHHHTYTMQTQLLASDMNVNAFHSIPSGTNHVVYYLGVYALISLVSCLVSSARYFAVYYGSLRASRTTFRETTRNVLRTPLRWLDTEPVGRILNRFTSDFASMDSQLTPDFALAAGSLLNVIGILAAALFVSPYLIIIAIILLAACSHIASRFIRGARSVKRLDSVKKSPMISHFTTSLNGMSTIRAFAKTPEFLTRMYNLIEDFTTATWHNWLFNQWVGFRISLVGSIFSTTIAVFVITNRGIDSSLAGFALAFSLEFAQSVRLTIMQLANVELGLNAAERIFEYRDLERENQGGVENLRASWPEEGRMEVKDLEVGYASDLPAILKGLTFSVEASQRIGVVGRTGAGKSTLSLAILRFLEARKGSITIDGIDISTIKLHDLRTRLSVIPQDLILFSGTIRSNLDPFDQYSDSQVREALQRVQLTSINTPPVAELVNSSTAGSVTVAEIGNTNMFLSLTSPISSGGTNLSQGQKQLVCLARAILSRPKLLILDEATSAVDMKTDSQIQRSIREEFGNTTLLVIAHRLSTVTDFDRILVMKDGAALEYGSPKELLNTEDGIFKDMVAQSGEKEELEAQILGA